MKTTPRTTRSALAWPLALAACSVVALSAWASPVVEPLVPGALALTEVQDQRVVPSLAVILRRPAAGAVRAGAIGASLPVYAAEGWSSDSAEPVAGIYTPSHRLSDWQELARANQGLTGGPFKEIVGASDVKTALLDLNIELKKFVTGTVFEAQSPNPVDPDPPRRAEIKSPFGEANRPSGPPLTAAERELDTLRASVMFWQLIDEVKPWAFAVVVLYWSLLAIRGYLRMQTRRRISALQERSRRHKRKSSRAATRPPAAQ